MQSVPLAFGLAVVLLLSTGSAAGAQATESEVVPRVPATIVLSDTRPAGSRFVLRRVPNAARPDVIVLAPDATADDLTDAVRTLLTARHKDGDKPVANQILRIRPTRSGAPRPAYPWIPRVLADVKGADRIDIPGVGNVRAVQIWLPGKYKSRPASRKPRV